MHNAFEYPISLPKILYSTLSLLTTLLVNSRGIGNVNSSGTVHTIITHPYILKLVNSTAGGGAVPPRYAPFKPDACLGCCCTRYVLNGLKRDFN